MYSLILQADYQYVSIGLCKGPRLIASFCDPKHKASANLMIRIQELLKTNQVGWADLKFIGVNQGPAPFTTLRVVITTANGINFAKKIPLVGVDGIKTLLQDYPSTTPLTVVLLNAFAQDVYFGIKQANTVISTGWKNISVLIDFLKSDFSETPVTFIGNGVLLFRQELEKTFSKYIHVPDPLPEYTSLEAVGKVACEQWQRQENVQDMLLPLYLKTQHYKPAM